MPKTRSKRAAEEASDNIFNALNYSKEALLARLTGGISPAATTLAMLDWWIHLHAAPGTRLKLAMLYADSIAKLGQHAALCATGGTYASADMPDSPRSAAQAWRREPYQFWMHAFSLTRQWWEQATKQVPGVDAHHVELVSFCARQWCDLFSPANFLLSNPEALQRTADQGGANLVAGFRNFVADLQGMTGNPVDSGADRFQVGKTIAITPGAVVFRNHLLELIQYAPTTATVRPEPIFITPAWIMKYYVLDLSPHNSLIRYLVAQGYTVFCISWRNVGAKDRNLSLEDYRESGFMAALDAVTRVVPDQRVHAVGYCLGGTLLSIAAAAMAGQGDDRLATLTLLAAQTDFTEPGGLGLFIGESEVNFLESMMWAQGYLSAQQMAAAFQALRPMDEACGRATRAYLFGERSAPNDLVAWNADSTHMPYRMHSEYLRKLFLNNELAAGRYQAGGRVIALRNIRTPIFLLGTDADRISPWRSVYKVHYQTDADVRFVLTSGGHNAGVVSEPGHIGRWYRTRDTPANGFRCGPDEWLQDSALHQGSWWPEWSEWLAQRSGAPRPAKQELGVAGSDQSALTLAPGRYVFQGSRLT
ncbi:alpha/beta fold hydrolase [Achromobacter spanius]|uniref:PHA/PHB synthase family protein n=1 Tax=Achromobacter spanius TaxID=217203 RepID=UPI0022261B32|nr:alpha/beta fold hydrolase [Achromobacter spanius]MCW3151705.1 alpha/beta fold hydrolase [Achromobacter spanius]